MPTIDLGVDFGSVKDMDKFAVLPAGSAPFFIEKIEQKATGQSSKTPGRPMLAWTLAFNHPETGQKVLLTWNSVLPWIPPGQTEVDISGVGMLVQICKAVGMPWTGRDLNPESYIGKGGTANVIQRKKQKKNEQGQYVDDPDGDIVNDFDRKTPFLY